MLDESEPQEFTGLARRLRQLKGAYPQADPAMVAEVVRAVLASMQGDLGAPETALLAEVAELGRTIARARSEIAALKVDDITASHIPSATDELDAIVAHTAAATEQILEVCEKLDAQGVGPEVTTPIYEACSFQDITGQRISKVVTTLKAIDAKVAHIIAAFTPEHDLPADLPAPPPQAALLNGPQLPAQAMDQSDIDRLLADF
jgi:chemotaxis protein CheZ